MSLSLKGISFRYPAMSEDLFTDLDLDIGAGESVALIGPSGRGKSTLMSIAGLLLAPDAGSVTIDGVVRIPADAPALLGNQVTWVLQTVSLLPRRTVLDNVCLPMLSSGSTRESAMRSAEEALRSVGLSDYLFREARTLSGGEQQRVGVARALATRPSVMLADEPTANLDRRTAQSVAAALYEAAQDTSLLLCTHDEEVASMADRIFVLGSA